MDQCLALSTSDFVSLCVQLSERIDGLKTQPLVTALIAAAAAALSAWLSTRGSMKASRKERRNKSQREALYGAQDAAQALRTEWTELMAWRDASEATDGGEVEDNPLKVHKEQDLLAAFEKVVSRIGDEGVKTKLNDWRDWARLYFHGSDQTDIHGERDRWRAAISACGERALSLD